MAGESAGGDGLLPSVTRLRTAIDEVTLALSIPGVADERIARARLLDQLDDYIIPRLSSLDAPLLAVVGGSTGAGKSTLVNSLVGHEVSEPGVLRPTTRSPVLTHHPDDGPWFTDQRILPGLARLTGATPEAASPTALRLVASDAVPQGLAILDAPDIDSVVAANRELAAELLAAADLWLFVTTAARYADAVPWDLLREAGERGASIAVVLDRVPEGAIDEIRTHLTEMLGEQGLGDAPLFTIVESALHDGLLPTEQSAPLHEWLTSLASDAAARAAVVRQTLQGALESLDARTRALAEAQTQQVAAGHALEHAARTAYAEALEHVSAGAQDGSLLRGEVLARWQEFVGTGEFFRQVESAVSRLRDRFTAFIKGQPPKAEHLGEALQTGVLALVANRAEIAAATTTRAWRTLPGGEQVLATHPELARSSADLDGQVERLVRDWQDDILGLVRAEGKDRRTTARIMAYGVNSLGVVLMLVTFASTAGITGAEVGIAGGTAIVGQKLLEAVFGDQAVRDLSRKARERLLERVGEVYAAERARYDKAVQDVAGEPGDPKALETAAAAVKAAR